MAGMIIKPIGKERMVILRESAKDRISL